MRVEGHAVYAGGGFTGSHVPLPTAPRPNGQRREREPVIVLQPLTTAQERALERRAVKASTANGPANPVGQEEARQFVEAYRRGETIKAIAKTHSRSTITIRAHLVRQGVTIRPPHNVVVTRISHTERQQMIDKYQAGMSLKKVAAAHGRVHGTVLKVLREAGVQTRPEGGQAKVFTAQEEANIVATYKRVGSLHGAEAELHISSGTIAKVLDRHGVDHSQRGGTPPLTAAEKARIYQLAADGMSMRKIGQTIGRSHSVVAKALRTA